MQASNREEIENRINLLEYELKTFYEKKTEGFFLLYNDFIVNIYIQLDWEQVFTTY